MSIGTLKARLMGALDVLPPSLVPNIINDALLEIYGLNDWGFLKKEDFVRTPNLITSGTASVTKFSNQVILNVIASTEVIALTANDVPLIGRQFRTFTPRITGRSWLYNITDFSVINEAAASGFIEILAIPLNDIHTISFNGVTFTFKGSPVDPFDVAIGPNPTTAATNLYNKIIALAAAGNTALNVASYNNTVAGKITVTYNTVGAIGNTYSFDATNWIIGTLGGNGEFLEGGLDNEVTLTIDPYFLDDTNTTVRYQILKSLYNPPTVTVNGTEVTDFNGWDFFISLKWQRKLNLGNNLNQVNDFDPARFQTDEPRHVIPHPFDSVGNPLYELYPAPRFERVYKVIYRLQGKSLLLFDDDGNDLLSDSDKLPGVLTEKFVLDYSKYKLYEYAIANADKYQLKNVGRFGNLMSLLMNKNDKMSIPNQLELLIKKDEENYPKAYLGDYMRMPYCDSLIGDLNFRGEFNYEYGMINNTVLIEF